jgi:hypothetical protein
MIITSLILAMAVLLGVLLWNVALRHGPVISTLEEWESRRLPVNLKTVWLLIDPAEEEYLRRQLPRAAFLTIRRERARLARRCVERVRKNATMILQMSGTAVSGPDAQLAAAARELSVLAAQVRANAILVQWRLWLCCVLPEVDISGFLQPDCKKLLDRSIELFRRTPVFLSKAHVPAV